MVALYVTQMSGLDLKNTTSFVPVTLISGYQKSDALPVDETLTHNRITEPANF